MAQTARPGADKAFDYTWDAAEAAAEQGRRTADQAADASRDVSDRTEDVARHGLQVVQRTADAEARCSSRWRIVPPRARPSSGGCSWN